MGLLSKLLFLPVKGPVDGAVWVARKIHETAETELNDPVRLRRALVELEADLDAGRIDEATFEVAEMDLLKRLQALSMQS